MKTITTIIFTLALIAGAQAQDPAHRAKIVEIEGEMLQTPDFVISTPVDKYPDRRREWLEIRAEIDMETTDPSGFIPELEARWFVVIKEKYSGKPVRLLGKATFRNIRTTDRRVFLSAYIDPDTLERLTGSSRPSENDIEAYALTISGPGILADGRYAAGLTMATAEKEAKWWEKWEFKSIEGAILPKSKTPFAPLWADRYPVEKPPTD
jgi:hypothetical protein